MVQRMTSIFEMPGQYFNAHAKFNINEAVYNKPLSKLEIHSLLENRDFTLWNCNWRQLNSSYPQDTTWPIG